jgi:hypothetical protein
MANVNIDTSSASYNDRRADFLSMLSAWRPVLNNYQEATPAAQAAWRAADPALDEILTWVEEGGSTYHDN